MKCFAKIVNGWKLLTFLVKGSILDVWQGSEYASVYNLLLIFLKIEDANKIDSVTKFPHFKIQTLPHILLNS